MTDNIFNKPIAGDIVHRSGGMVAQSDPQLLVDALDAVFTIAGLESVKWHQYTPYFNDGDPCEFGVYEPRFRFETFEEDAGDYEDGYETPFSLSYKSNGVYPYRPEGFTLTDEEEALIKAVDTELDSGRHYVVLNELFGDPAEIVATPEGFSVEYYDHE